MAIRIRFEYTRYPHLGSHSGYAQLVRHLDTQSYSVTMHSAPHSDADLPRWQVPFRFLLRRVFRRSRLQWYKLSDMGAEVRALLSCLAGRFDIVHFLDGEHSGHILPYFAKSLRLSRPRFVVTFHQPPEVLQKLIDASYLRRFDRILLVSPSQLPLFKQHAHDGRLQVLLHGVDADFFHPLWTPNRTDRVRCITVGDWLRDRDTFEGVARALLDDTGIHFDVVTSKGSRLEGLPNVTIHSGIDDATLAELYRSADVLFLPLLQATANNALLEGMASGLAVVATDLEAVRAYLPDGQAILLDNRVDAFVDALVHLREKVEERHELGRRARARAEELAWPRIIHQYESIYADVIAGRTAPSRAELRQSSGETPL